MIFVDLLAKRFPCSKSRHAKEKIARETEVNILQSLQRTNAALTALIDNQCRFMQPYTPVLAQQDLALLEYIDEYFVLYCHIIKTHLYIGRLSRRPNC
jgi:hypothetical protein